MAHHEDYAWNFNIDAAVGIDLGTTYSCVSVYRDGCITVVADDGGRKLLRSAVAFIDNGNEIKPIVGQSATENVEIYANHIVTEGKRLMGRKFADPDVQTNMKRWPFQVTANNDGNAQITMNFDGRDKLNISPQQISSHVLAKLKKMAEKFLGQGKKVTHAVITVPAHFNELQRKATINAAQLADLTVIAIINEPSAAALAYGIRTKIRDSRKILVVDVGGGTSDVALVNVVEEKFEILACRGDNNVGGEDFDSNLVTHCLEQIHQKYHISVQNNGLAMRRLRSKCGEIKHKLSDNPADPDWSCDLELDELAEDTDVSLSISRTKFEEINQKVFDKVIELVSACLNDAKSSISDVYHIIPVGGSMRIPRLREMLEEFFHGKFLHSYINPDEAVAVGAAILSAQKLGIFCGRELMLSDITPHSLGIKVNSHSGDEEMRVIIPRHTKIPCQISKPFSPCLDFQTSIKLEIYQGENKLVKDNAYVGQIKISGLKPDLIVNTKIDVTFEINENGVCEISAQHTSSGKEVRKELTNAVTQFNILKVTRQMSQLDSNP